MPKLTLVAALYIHSGREAEFDQFEAAAARIMARHGGAIDRRIRIARAAGDNLPHEVHIVTFPDDASFQRYRADPELHGLAELRARAIRETVVWTGSELAGFET